MEKTKGKQQSRRYSSWGSWEIMEFCDSPLQNADFHAIRHEGCYLSLSSKCSRWMKLIFHPGDDPWFPDMLCLNVQNILQILTQRLKQSHIWSILALRQSAADPTQEWLFNHGYTRKGTVFHRATPACQSPCHTPACAGTPSHGSLNSCAFPGSLHCVQILICETTHKGWWFKYAKATLSSFLNFWFISQQTKPHYLVEKGK